MMNDKLWITDNYTFNHNNCLQKQNILNYNHSQQRQIVTATTLLRCDSVILPHPFKPSQQQKQKKFKKNQLFLNFFAKFTNTRRRVRKNIALLLGFLTKTLTWRACFFLFRTKRKSHFVRFCANSHAKLLLSENRLLNYISPFCSVFSKTIAWRACFFFLPTIRESRFALFRSVLSCEELAIEENMII